MLWVRIRIPRILMFFGLLNPDPSLFLRIRIRIWIQILPSTSKKVRKTFISTLFLLLFGYLSLKTDVYVPLKSNKLTLPLTKKAGSRAGSGRPWYRSADPDPYQNVTDPQHWFQLYDVLLLFQTQVDNNSWSKPGEKTTFSVSRARSLRVRTPTRHSQ